MSREYQAYLASREWSLKREAVRDRSGNECERCWKAPHQAVHHMTYEHLYDEPLEELLAVCNPCHAWLSAKSDTDPAAIRMGVVTFLPTHSCAAAFFPDDAPHFGLRMRQRGDTLPVSLFAFSPSLEYAVGDAWFMGYHIAEDPSLFSRWYAPIKLVGTDAIAPTIDEAWSLFLLDLAVERRGDWRFVPDARFGVYEGRK